MINSKKTLLGGMDGDTALQLIDEDAYLNLMNARVVSASETGRGLRAENLLGTTEIIEHVFPPYGVSFPLGSGIDNVRDRIIYFAHNTFDDNGIYCYDKTSGITYAVLYDSQVIGGLGFSKDSRIDRNVRIVSDLVYWTDDNNEPRRMNIEAGIKMNQASYDTDVLPYSYPMNPEVITIIRRSSFYPPDTEKDTDGDYENNFIADESFQFAFRYFYRDYEESVIGAFSELSPYNGVDDTFNFINVTMTFGEVIEQDVLSVELIVRFGNTNNMQTIYTWDAEDIALHNSNIQQLEFNFYNDVVGTPIDLINASKPFDSVPIQSKTIELVENRVFLGNNLEGYDTPTVSSLSISVYEAEGGEDIIGEWQIYTITFYLDSSSTDRDYYVFVPPSSPFIFYYFIGQVPPAVPIDPIDLSTATFANYSVHGMADYLAVNSGVPYDTYDFFPSNATGYTSVVSGGTVVLAGARGFKSNSTYRVAVVFFDKYRRKSGVVFLPNNGLTMPDRSYAQTVYNLGINWVLINTADMTDEIPEWAYYYAVVRTQSLTTRFFVQAQAASIFYCLKDDEGLFTFTTTAYDVLNYGVAIDISTLNGFGLGYTYEVGDLVNLYFESGITGKQTLSIQAQVGKWIVLQLQDFGTLGGSLTPLFEIYTPYRLSVNEPYFEVGNIYQILNPGEATRVYSVSSGSLNGDSYIIERNSSNDYFAEAMSPNDKFWKNWYSDVGWSNFIDTIGQKLKKSSISWSNKYIDGTKVNGLSSFDALDEQSLPSECGEINKLQRTSKIGNELGIVMLSICRNETVSMYMGEVQLYGSNEPSTLAQSPSVIGTINVLKGSYGTVNPESVIEFRGLVFWFDVLNGKVVQYSSNGLQPISDYKMARFWQRYSAAYLLANTNNLDNINGFHHVSTCIDPFTNEFLITVPALIYENYADILPSYSSVPSYATSIINRFDIYDQLGKTMSFDIIGNKWRQNYEYMPEWMDYLQTGLYSYKNDCTLYLHNSNVNAYNTWYNIQYPVRLCMSWGLKEAPSAIKDVYDTALESNAAPDFTVLYGTYPWVQLTDLTSDNYDNPEGVFYAMFFRDRLTPGSSTVDENLYSGNIVKENCPKLMFEWQQYTDIFYITFVNLGFQISKGTQSLIGR